MEPSIGRIVHYTLSQLDAELIASRRGYAAIHGTPVNANAVNAGDTFPAVIVRHFGGSATNLRVLLDGDDTYWACSRVLAESGVPGTWAWPYPYFSAGKSSGTYTSPYYVSPDPDIWMTTEKSNEAA